jgi:hypothetical protein
MRHYGSLDTYFRVGLMTAGNLCTKEELAAIDDAIQLLERCCLEVEIREPDLQRKHEGVRLLTRVAFRLGTWMSYRMRGLCE